MQTTKIDWKMPVEHFPNVAGPEYGKNNYDKLIHDLWNCNNNKYSDTGKFGKDTPHVINTWHYFRSNIWKGGTTQEMKTAYWEWKGEEYM